MTTPPLIADTAAATGWGSAIPVRENRDSVKFVNFTSPFPSRGLA